MADASLGGGQGLAELRDPRLALREARQAAGRDLDLLPVADARRWAEVRSTLEAAEAVLRPVNDFEHGPAHRAALLLSWDGLLSALAVGREDPIASADELADRLQIAVGIERSTARWAVSAVPSRTLA